MLSDVFINTRHAFLAHLVYNHATATDGDISTMTIRQDLLNTEPVKQQLERVSQQLFDWGIPQQLWDSAHRRGMTEDQFTEFYNKFIETNLNKRNCQGKLVLVDHHRAILRGYLALRDAGWPSAQSSIKLDPNWQPASVRSKSGKKLDWHVFTNVDPGNAAQSHQV
jgi:hypothetical protein